MELFNTALGKSTLLEGGEGFLSRGVSGVFNIFDIKGLCPFDHLQGFWTSMVTITSVSEVLEHLCKGIVNLAVNRSSGWFFLPSCRSVNRMKSGGLIEC